MRLASFTVDVDRDANLPKPGSMKAVSREVGGDDSPRFDSSAKGLEVIASVLEAVGIRGTFFMEAETALEISKRLDLPALMASHEVASHGLGHEDLTGAGTGVVPSEREIGDIIDGSTAILEDLFGHAPVGFRAPYLHMSHAVADVLKSRGYRYSSSTVADMRDGAIPPTEWPNGLAEIPVARALDASGRKMQTYLWPLHEGRRPAMDYVRLIPEFKDGLLVLGDHSWHMAERTDRLMTKEEAASTKHATRTILQAMASNGIRFVRLDEAVSSGL